MTEPCRLPYGTDAIPTYCRLPLAEHSYGAGCWSILYGFVAERGLANCRECHYCDKGYVGSRVWGIELGVRRE